MLKLKQAYGLVLLLALTLVHPIAQAYDEDTHFYGTYSMARFAGIDHAVAVKLALTTQWMDECFLSDPTSMIILPLDGVKKRRLLHFPSTRIGNKIEVQTQDEGFGIKNFGGLAKIVSEHFAKKYDLDLATLIFSTTTEENSPFASSLMREGLREGNLMKAAASLHTLEDSYAHAGTSAEIGHTRFWHWPDRPFESPESLKKYFEMTQTLFQAMVAIRTQLPDSAKDCSLTSNGKPNCTLNAEDLNAAYMNVPSVIKTVSVDVLQSLEYIRPTLQEFILKAEQVGYLKPGNDYNAILESILTSNLFFVGNPDPAHRIDSYSILERFIKILMIKQGSSPSGSYLDADRLPRELDLITDPNVTTAQYIRNTGINTFTRDVTRSLLVGYVPIPLSGTHREEAENDQASTRPREMDIRNRHMQALIQELYGIKLQFVPNNSKDHKGFGEEVTMNPAAEPIKIENQDPGTVYATFTLEEKNRFDHMIFNYLFPSLGDEALSVITRFMADVREGEAAYLAPEKKPATRWEKLWQVSSKVGSWLESWVVRAEDTERFLVHLNPYRKNLIKDLLTAHMKPIGDEKFYQNAGDFEDYKNSRRQLEKNPALYPQFLGPGDSWAANANGSALQYKNLVKR